MERRSKMLLATALGATIVVVACSFPDVTYRSDDGDAGSEGDTGASEEDTGTEPDADSGVEDSGTIPDGEALIEAGFPSEGGVVEDAAACEAGLRMCDCDEDNWLVKDCDAGPDSGKKGNDKDGWDCDDHNRDVNPESGYKAVARPDGSWDWNCDGNVEKAYEGYSCPAAACKSGAVGYKDDVQCGKPGTVYQCTGVANLLLCSESERSQNEIRNCK